MNNPMHKKSVRISNANRLRIFLGLSLSVLALGLFVSCRDKTEKRSFSEVKGFNAPVQNQEIKLPEMPPAAPAGGDAQLPPGHPGVDAPDGISGHLKWQLPKGWTAHAGSGMYYAVIKTSGGPEAREIGVLALAGEAGGLQANTARWAGQLGLQLSDDKVGGFLANSRKLKTPGNMDVTLLDFSAMVGDDDSPSMMVAVTKPMDETYFIKMMGKKGVLAKYKQDFAQFCNSLVYE